jgi:hypothetical protein
MEAAPMIKYQEWGDVPYTTKDNRVVNNKDFLPAEAAIGDYLKMLNGEIKTNTIDPLAKFLPHHNHSKFLDNDWKDLWDNVSRADDALPEGEHWWDLPEEEWLTLKVANQFTTVIDYANSYQSEHKDEHMQQF